MCSFEDVGVFACLLFSLIKVVFRQSVSKIGAIITDFVSIFFVCGHLNDLNNLTYKRRG